VCFHGRNFGSNLTDTVVTYASASSGMSESFVCAAIRSGWTPHLSLGECVFGMLSCVCRPHPFCPALALQCFARLASDLPSHRLCHTTMRSFHVRRDVCERLADQVHDQGGPGAGLHLQSRVRTPFLPACLLPCRFATLVEFLVFRCRPSPCNPCRT
jgi:hypothetical protein